MSTDVSGVFISFERLRALEALEAEQPAIIAKAKADRDAERLRELHEKQKANPEPNKKRALANYHKNKEEINAKRREQYKAKKALESTRQN